MKRTNYSDDWTTPTTIVERFGDARVQSGQIDPTKLE